MTGKLIVVEGPNGVGKSTLAALLAEAVRTDYNVDVVSLSQPSDTPFGRLVRSGEAHLMGHALAMAVAADRLTQFETTVKPALDRDAWVILDRHTPSSLVLQAIDGLTLPDIWFYNQWVPAPDLVLYLENAANVILERLAERGKLSRLEKIGSPQRELDLYAEARTFLGDQNWPQQVINSQGMSPEVTTSEALRLVNITCRKG